MASPQELVLNFFPLHDSNFSFPIYRRQFITGEKSENFPGCSKRPLPSNPNEEKYLDYWVSFDEKSQDGFSSFECNSNLNFHLTNEFLFRLIVRSCENNKVSGFYLENDHFIDQRVYFEIAEYPEGKQVIWLEPYYLKSAKKFGFLVDFKFQKKDEVPFNKRVQQLSLSLDYSGKSNTNYYSDRFQKIQEFVRKYHKQIFPLSDRGAIFSVEDEFVSMKSDSLEPKRYVFGNKAVDKSQFMGVKNKGPLLAANSQTKLFFIYRQVDRPFSHDLYRALRGDTFGSTFPGMETMFRYKLSSENVSGKAIKDFSKAELEQAVDSILAMSKIAPVVPVLVVPFNKDDLNKESETQYYSSKHVFLRHHLPCQFVSLKTLSNKEQFKWAISNIGLQLFAKMGGQPWMVEPETKKCLIIGLGQSHKKTNGVIEKYFAYSILTDSSGLYKDLKILGHSSNKNAYLDGFQQRLTEVIRQYFDEYDNFVVHTSFRVRDDEINIVNNILDKLIKNANSSKEFTVMRFNEHNKYFGYSKNSNSMIPYESSMFRLSYKEFLVWFEGLQFQNPTVKKRIERPVYVEFLHSSRDLDYTKMKSYLQDAVNLSGANWRGFNAKSLPVSMFYAQLVAKYYKEFQQLGLEDVNIEKITPWFL